MTTVTRVYALGGSILAPDGPSEAYAQAFASLLLERRALGERGIVVTGGGGPARRYIKAARSLGIGEETLDLIGIDATRLNARFFAAALARQAGPVVDPAVPHEIEAAARAAVRYPFVVMGGTVPGHSTDFVAASLATAVGAADLYVLTNVDGVYTADPRTDPKAERIPQLSFERLLEIVGEPTWTAGRTGVVDPKCARHAAKHELPVTVLDGRAVDRVRAALAGDAAVGSRVGPQAAG